ncbi:MAG: 16S rRNA (cytidine(1402)-2'-O)-methyltransferase [Bacteroidales bacterium]
MSKLYLVPTPIGNLKDMTFRAIEVLKESDLILAEDTRKSGFLLKHFQVEIPMRSFHKFNEHKTLESIINELQQEKIISLISDAGTPGISDPGFLLVRECIANDIPVESLPGPTAFLPALVNSGLPCDRFCFEGFLPQKKGRNKKMQEIKDEERTMVFYESPYRLIKTLELFIEFFGEERRASVSRELTKLHEETIRGTLAEIRDYYGDKAIKGEIVVVVEGKN